ncbi:D-lactate dehydrogenase [Nitrosovibrio tenuis]|uniref:D-lactate dehydrogenase n=1 Tax=Nitrosovibrio tenuis TaxID=1233 RepID=A0A1H7RIL3_9PROT|nr:D-lactate dehydrogenase [Nitrosovibrio tenuis]
MTSHFLAQLGTLLPPGRILTDPVDCYAYAYDNSRKIFPPEAVAFPLDAEEIKAIVLLCNAHNVPLTPRGRGTGTSGGSLPERGGVALSLERMTRIVTMDAANRVAVAEPGVINQSLQDSAKSHGFFWAPDPSSAAYSSIGGNLATSAGGPHAVKYGTTRDHVLGLKAVTGEGSMITTGCYTTKGVVGYDLTRLLVGSEGTLAVITEATLKLTPLPEAVGGLTAHYRDIASCAEAIVAVMALPQTPSALEFLDSGSLDLIRSRFPEMVPADATAMLMIEVDGSERYISESCNAILSACRNDGLINAERTADAAALWRARKTLSPLLRDIAPKKINEDVVVPVSALPGFLQELGRLSDKYRIANVNFGHAGNGNIHVNLLVNPDNFPEMARAEQCLNEIFDLVIRLRGTLSGEHGVGSEKRAYVGKEIDMSTMALMKGIKRVFDPNNILNPGKLFL